MAQIVCKMVQQRLWRDPRMPQKSTTRSRPNSQQRSHGNSGQAGPSGVNNSAAQATQPSSNQQNYFCNDRRMSLMPTRTAMMISNARPTNTIRRGAHGKRNSYLTASA
jgi:hypothetical protein